MIYSFYKSNLNNYRWDFDRVSVRYFFLLFQGIKKKGGNDENENNLKKNGRKKRNKKNKIKENL